MITESLTFDDVCIVPSYSEIESRNDVDISVTLKEGFSYATPIIVANMKATANYAMLRKVLRIGGLCLLHRFDTVENICTLYEDLIAGDIAGKEHVGVSLGVKDDDKDNFLTYWYGYGVKIFCLDIAHGHCKRMLDMIDFIKRIAPNCLLIAGNVATGEGALDLWNAGADVVKAGLANGSVCSTKINTGVNVGQVTTLMQCAQYKQFSLLDRPLISDGGIRYPGDVTKAMVYADMVMVGGIAGKCFEAEDTFEGSSTFKKNYVEGVSIKPTKLYSVEELYKSLHEGLRSGMSYVGARSIEELHRKYITWVKVER